MSVGGGAQLSLPRHPPRVCPPDLRLSLSSLFLVFFLSNRLCRSYCLQISPNLSKSLQLSYAVVNVQYYPDGLLLSRGVCLLTLADESVEVSPNFLVVVQKTFVVIGCGSTARRAAAEGRGRFRHDRAQLSVSQSQSQFQLSPAHSARSWTTVARLPGSSSSSAL